VKRFIIYSLQDQISPHVSLIYLVSNLSCFFEDDIVKLIGPDFWDYLSPWRLCPSADVDFVVSHLMNI